MPRRFLILSFASVVLFLSGCMSYGPEELDRLTKEDPQFKQMITNRDQIHGQIRLIKNDLLQKKQAMDAQVEKFRAEYDTYAKAQNLKIEQYGAAIETNRQVLKRDLDLFSAQLTTKFAQLEEYQKTLSNVKKMLGESKGIQLSGDEKQRWEERILMLSEKIRPLTEEIQELKLRIRLKKQKISFLK